jgi:excisionase family DNA binding protein
MTICKSFLGGNMQMHKNEQIGRLLTCAEAANALGLKEATIRVWIARRRLASVKLGRAVRVPAQAVETLIAQSTIPARVERG